MYPNTKQMSHKVCRGYLLLIHLDVLAVLQLSDVHITRLLFLHLICEFHYRSDCSGKYVRISNQLENPMSYIPNPIQLFNVKIWNESENEVLAPAVG